MQVAVVTFDGFNELDSFIASALINRCRKDGLEAFITTPTPVVTSMNGVEVTGQRPMEFVTEADVVLIGSGVKAREVVADDRLISKRTGGEWRVGVPAASFPGVHEGATLFGRTFLCCWRSV